MTDTENNLRLLNEELERQVADLRRQNVELRQAVAALLEPAPSQVLQKREGSFW